MLTLIINVDWILECECLIMLMKIIQVGYWKVDWTSYGRKSTRNYSKWKNTKGVAIRDSSRWLAVKERDFFQAFFWFRLYDWWYHGILVNTVWWRCLIEFNNFFKCMFFTIMLIFPIHYFMYHPTYYPHAICLVHHIHFSTCLIL